MITKDRALNRRAFDASWLARRFHRAHGRINRQLVEWIVEAMDDEVEMPDIPLSAYQKGPLLKDFTGHLHVEGLGSQRSKPISVGRQSGRTERVSPLRAGSTAVSATVRRSASRWRTRPTIR